MINKRTRLSLMQLVVTLCFLALSLSLVQAEVTLNVGDGSGLPGSSVNPVTVSLENQNDEIAGIQLEVCDGDDYLTCTGCDTMERTSSFDCLINELNNGCCRVILAPLGGGLIGEGTGSIFTIKYDVSSSAPEGECKDLNPENVSVADVSHDALDVTAQSGEFCFVSTTTTVVSTTTTVRERPCLAKEIYSENAEEVVFLRNFRDQVLRKTQSGRELIRLYYQFSPAIMKAIEEDKELREKVKEIIDKALPLITGEAE